MGHEFVYYDEKTTDVDELARRSEDADIVMIANNPYPKEAFEKASNLKLINVAFTGVDHVDGGAAEKQDIQIANAAGYADQAVAELAVGLVIDLYRKISQGNQDIRKENFPGPIKGAEIEGKTVGIIGVGKIGLKTAKLFEAFGANLIGYNRSENEEAKNLGLEYVDLETIFKKSDIVSLHLPLNDQTRGIIKASHFDLMKKNAVFVNVARGPIIDNDALAEALNKEKIAGAGIDVFDMEPPIPQDYPLLNAKNTILTPHVAFLTKESMVKRAHIAFDNTIAYLEGDPQNIVEP